MAEIINLYAHEKQLENGGKPSTVESILGPVRVAAETAVEFKTIADVFIDSWGLRPIQRTEAATPGNPPAPAIYDYPSAWSKESLDRKIQNIRVGAETLGRQIIGLFNLAYESPTPGEQTAAPMAGIGAIPPIVIIAVLGLLIYMGMKK